ncbi:MAG: FAD-dependent oxidoreductase [Dechloromonas sp.]|nr:MAG: FAD-dependent oxidoreductase [Dechloromonas sp.]
MKVAVIGGGWAGLAAAVDLTAAGVKTTLYEAGRQPGGRARAIEVDGAVDNGQHILLGAYRETLALMRQVGADPDRLLERRPLAVYDPTGFHLALPHWPAPLNVAWGLLTASGTGWREKLATARWMESVKRRRFRLKEDLSVAEWLDAAGQTGALRRHLWEPLCLAALNIPAERASAQIFANVLRDSLGSSRRSDTDLLLPRTDLGQLLPTPAAQWLHDNSATLSFGTRVGGLSANGDGIVIDETRFDAVIVATAPQHAEKLWPELTCDFDYEPIATVTFSSTQQPDSTSPAKTVRKIWPVGRRPQPGVARLRPERSRRMGNPERQRTGSSAGCGTGLTWSGHLAKSHPRKARHFCLPSQARPPGFRDL